MCKLGMMSQELLKIKVKLLLSANKKSYIPRQLAQQRVTFSDLEWPFYTSIILKSILSALRAISEVAELVVLGGSTVLTCLTKLKVS